MLNITKCENQFNWFSRFLNDIKEALKEKDYENAEKLLDQLIEDTQKGIED